MTSIKFKVTEPCFISLKIFDRLGAEVTTLVNEKKAKGEYSVQWNASGYPNGIYFCRLQTNTCYEVKKMNIFK